MIKEIKVVKSVLLGLKMTAVKLETGSTLWLKICLDCYTIQKHLYFMLFFTNSNSSILHVLRLKDSSAVVPGHR